MLTAVSPVTESQKTNRSLREIISTSHTRESLSREAVAYFDRVYHSPSYHRKMGAYLENTAKYLAQVVPADQRVLVVGGLTAEVVAQLRPAYGVGLDTCRPYIEGLRKENRNPRVQYFSGKLEDYTPEMLAGSQRFDYVIVLNTVDHSQDVFALLESMSRFLHEDGRVILSMVNPLWHSLLKWASNVGIRVPDYDRNLVASQILETGLEVKRFKVTDVCRRILFPKPVPFFSNLCNRWLAKFPILNSLCFVQYVTARPVRATRGRGLSCSVIIPCYNEEGNIEECIRRVPSMGPDTEVVVVDDGSKDRTLAIAQTLAQRMPNLTVVTYGKNRGKGQAVMEGIRRSRGEVVMILDADMTVPPEELVDFYEALQSGACDFASGTRFLYPMEQEAMRFANFLGNLVFSKLVQLIVGSPVSDTLCGTKAMRRRDFKELKVEDSAWGDFDLIFHAAKRKLRCVQIPVHYKSRKAGDSKMKAFSAGFRFLKLCLRQWAALP